MVNPIKDEGLVRDAGFDPLWFPWNNGNDHNYRADQTGWVRIMLYGGAGLPDWPDTTREARLDGPSGYVITRRGVWTGGQLRLQVQSNPGGSTGYTDWFDWHASAGTVEAKLHALGGDAADATVTAGAFHLPWHIDLGGSDLRLTYCDNSMLEGTDPIAQVGEHNYRVMYRVWLEEGDKLRIRLGGRPTVSGSKSPGSWGSAGSLNDFEDGKAIRGGWPDGGEGVEQTSTVRYGRSRTPWVWMWGGWMWMDWDPVESTRTRELHWRCNGAGGASRVWLTPKPGEDGEPKAERPIIVEPGEGSRPIFTRVRLDVSGDESFTDDGAYPADDPHMFSCGHRYAVRTAERYSYPLGGDLSSNHLPSYETGPLHLTPEEENVMFDCSDNSVPIPSGCLPGVEYDGADWAVWGDMDAATGDPSPVWPYGHLTDYGPPVKMNETDSSYPPSVGTAREFHSHVGDGDPAPTPPGDDEHPRVAGPGPGYYGQWPDPYPLEPELPYSTMAETRFGAAGGEQHGANGEPSAFGPRRPGGGGFGGGCAGDATEETLPTGYGGRVMYRAWRQWPAKAGGRWWNDARVDASGTWLIEYGDPLFVGPNPNNGPMPDSDPPLNDPWLIGFGAMWLCGEEPTGAKRTRWRVGHVGWGRNDGW